MKEADMLKVAELLRRVIIDEEKPEAVKNDVARLCSEFQKVEYCFDQ
jgi:glycine/serine hydroxymethyltransferase